jgi:hypothetical protein
MTTLTLTMPFSRPVPNPLKRKRVLLVDTSSTRDLRAEVMRKLGMDVDCAADIGEARSWWRADLYNLVLISSENELGRRDKFCDDIRGAMPRQPLAFLVGRPEYIAGSPNADEALPAQKDSDPALWVDVKAALSADISGGLPQRWGILEACRRISAVRSVSDTRSKARRDRPLPPRDPEAPRFKRPGDEPATLIELQSAETP